MLLMILGIANLSMDLFIGGKLRQMYKLIGRMLWTPPVIIVKKECQIVNMLLSPDSLNLYYIFSILYIFVPLNHLSKR